MVAAFFGAGDRDRTGTMFPSADFKSAASASSATPTNRLHHILTRLRVNCKRKSTLAGAFFSQIAYFSMVTVCITGLRPWRPATI